MEMSIKCTNQMFGFVQNKSFQTSLINFYPKINNTDNINNNNNTIRILSNTYEIKEIKKIIQLF